MLTITNILNPLTGGKSTDEYQWVEGKPLSEYIGYNGECVVACGREIINLPLDKIFPARVESYTIAPLPAGGDRATLRALSYAVMSAALLAIPGGWIVAPVKGTLFWVGGNLIETLLRDKKQDYSESKSYSWRFTDNDNAAFGTPMPIIYGKTRVRPTLKSNYIKIDGDKQTIYALFGLAAHRVDETYYSRFVNGLGYTIDSSPVRSLATADEPGKTYQCINDSVTTALYNDTQRWKVGHGTASFNEDILINGRAITDFNDDVDWDTRPGLPEQTLIEGFDTTFTNYAQSESLYFDYPNADLKGAGFMVINATTVSWDKHNLQYHGEIYEIPKGTQTYTSGTTNYVLYTPGVSYTSYSVGTSIPSGSYAIFEFNWGNGTREYPCKTTTPESTDWYEPTLDSANIISSAHNIEVVLEFPYGLYGINDSGAPVNGYCRIFAQYREQTGDDTDPWTDFDFVSMSQPGEDISEAYDDLGAVQITRNKRTQFYVSIKATSPGEPLDYDTHYEVRVIAHSACIVNLVNVTKIVYGETNISGEVPGLTYPGEPLLAIKALASAQISGNLDVQVDVERSNVWVYNGSAWVEKEANNHAWAVYDILANGHSDHPAYPTYGNDDADAIYGCAIDKDRIDYTSFLEWAENIDDIGYELNIVFDTAMTAWDAVLRICQEGRGMVYPVGTKIYAFTDKEASVSQVFTMGNIHLDTFVQQYMSSKDRANMVEVTFHDANRNYEKTIAAVRSADWDSTTNPSSPASITLYGTTGFDQAVSIAAFMLRNNELISNTIKFSVDVEALAVQAGDVVEIQHDVITTGQGGRITAVDDTTFSVTFDRTLSISAGTTYELVVWHEDGTIDRTNITGSSDTDTLTWASQAAWETAWTNAYPAAYELYSFGVASTHTKKYRVTKISRTNELMRALTLVEYDEDVYDVCNPATETEGAGYYFAPRIVMTSDEDVADVFNPATNVQLREDIMTDESGDLRSAIVVTWDTTEGDPRGMWRIWIRNVDQSDVNWQGEYDEGETYGDGDKVIYDGKVYMSIADNNTSTPG